MDSYRGELDDPMSLNLYAYCQGNPVKYTDNDGNSPTILIGAIVGGVFGGSLEILSQAISGQKINWKKVAVSTASGALEGAVMGSGLGIVGAAAANGAIAAGEDAANQYIDTGKVNVKQSLKEGGKSGLVSLVKGKVGKSKAYDINNTKKHINGTIATKKKNIKEGLKKINKEKLPKKKKVVKKIKEVVKHAKKAKKVIRKAVKKFVRHVARSYIGKTIKRIVKKVKPVAKKIVRKVRTTVRRTAAKAVSSVRRFFSRFRW